jgi:predicted nucleic acid-binding protein
MISTFTAFIDSNVFYGARLRSLVLFAAQSKMFRARWSNRVQEEWAQALVKKRKHPSITREALQLTINAMNSAVPDCLVTGYEALEATLSLPDPDDRHVLAAAIRVGASTIVTFNLKDFPAELLEPFGVHVTHPDVFLIDTMDIDPIQFAECVRLDFAHYKSPKLTFETYVEDLKNAGVPETAALIEDLKVLIVP